MLTSSAFICFIPVKIFCDWSVEDYQLNVWGGLFSNFSFYLVDLRAISVLLGRERERERVDFHDISSIKKQTSPWQEHPRASIKRPPEAYLKWSQFFAHLLIFVHNCMASSFCISFSLILLLFCPWYSFLIMAYMIYFTAIVFLSTLIPSRMNTSKKTREVDSCNCIFQTAPSDARLTLLNA